MSCHEVFDSIPVHSSAETEMITLDDLFAFAFDWYLQCFSFIVWLQCLC
jgi:hypothetical protein